MFIQSISIVNFGGVCSCEAEFTPEWNLLNSRHTDEIAVALSLLLCNTPPPVIPEQWLQEDTRISAIIRLNDTTYSVSARPQLDQLRLLATDPAGADVTAQYQHTLAHCAEQDDIEVFDGQDNTISMRLYRYWCRDEFDDLSRRTDRFADTKTFRSFLHQFIQDYCPEPINSQKGYQTVMNQQGVFDVSLPGISGKLHLSETEKRLFYYICFLNVAEFWAGFEAVRDLHHEKKPLLIQNFLEFLDEGTDISSLITRTQKLHRQIIILTCPMDDESKKKWMGEKNGLFLESCGGVCSL